MSTDIEQLGELLKDRYAVERELGRGGMATVYYARDLARDGAPVAIKVLLPDLAIALGPERFRREVEIARQLDHPNVLSVLDSGEAAGRLYFVMPYVAGESLRMRIDREGQLPVDEAVRIAAAVGRGLEHAHAKGIVHRDVKPENILLDGDRVLVADFGIARSLDAGAQKRLTQTGVTLGTPLYMSPEQSLGERVLDGRSDEYALACVLYEMLVGQPPFTGPNQQAIMARHHMEEVPSVTVVRPTVSDEVEAITVRALAKGAADRFPDVGTFAGALERCLATGHTTENRTVAGPRQTRAMVAAARTRRRGRMLAAVGVLALAAAGVGAWQARSGGGALELAGDLAEQQVAVLYLEDATGGRLAYLADGITDLLIDELAKAGLDVVSRNGVQPFRGLPDARDSLVRAMGGATGRLGLIVDGAVEERDGRARVTLVLATGAGGRVRSDEFTFPLDSALARGDSLAPHVAEMEEFLKRAIGREVNLQRQRRAAGSDEAWTAAQRAELARKQAEAAWLDGDTTGTGRLLATADSLAAIAGALAPTWAQPLVFRGQTARFRAAMDRRPREARPWLDSAMTLAGAALTREPRDAAALELRGSLAYDYVLYGLDTQPAAVERRVTAAAEDLRAAVERDRTRATAWVRLSELAYRQHNVQDAYTAAREAYEADAYLSAAPDVLWRLFATSYDLNQPVDAQRWCETGRARFPELPDFLRCQILLMTMRGAEQDIPHGWQVLDELDRLTPAPDRPWESRFNRALFAAALGRAGLADSARALLHETRADERIDPRGELLGYQAFARTVIGDRDEALRLLEAYLEKNPEHREGFTRINAWWWDPLKQDPRFTALVSGG